MKELIIEKVSELRRHLNKSGLRAESSLLLLLLKFAGYDDEWRSKVEELAQTNPRPFDAWFGEKDRIYIPFSEAALVVDQEVDDALKSVGYKVTDYIRGYAEKDGRTMKIGKIISRAKRDAIKYIDRLIEARKGVPGQEEELDQIVKHRESLVIYWDRIANTFRDSPHRTYKGHRGNLSIVISQSPHDVAQMSYDRSWKSCMELGRGIYYREALCEVSGGGMVAYLINQDDTEIKNPVARIHIRRFDGPDGRVIAKAEDRVYGEDVEGFKKAVNDWVNGMNKDYPVGRYRMKGGHYSDTYDARNFYATPENEEELLDWIEGDLPDTKSTTWTLNDKHYYDLAEAGYWSKDNPFWSEDDDGQRVFDTEREAIDFMERLKMYDETESWAEYVVDFDEDDSYEERIEKLQEAEEERFNIQRNDIDHTKDMKQEAIKKIIEKDRAKKKRGEPRTYSQDAYELMAEFLTDSSMYWTDLKKAFYATYPELLSTEEFLNAEYYTQEAFLKDLAGTVSDEHEKRLRGALKAKIMETLDLEKNKALTVETGRGGYRRSYDVRYTYYRHANLIRGIDYIDDELYEHIKELAFTDIFKSGMTDEDTDVTMKALLEVISPDKISKENLKDLIRSGLRYYDETAWEYDEKISIHTLGPYFNSLGKEGRGFAVFLRRQLDDIDKTFKTRPTNYWNGDRNEHEKAILESRLVFVINTLTTGKEPDKGWYIHGRDPDQILTKKDLVNA